MTVTILFFVEDPGAANFVAPLPALLAEQGIAVRLLATGPARAFLAERDIPAENIPAENVPATTAARTLLDREAVEAIVIGTSENPASLGFALVEAARRQCIPTLGVVDGPASTAWRFRGLGNNPLAHAPDWVLAADAETRENFIELGLAPDRVMVCDHPAFDVVRAKALALAAVDRDALRHTLLPGAPAHQPVLTFVAEQRGGLDEAAFRRAPDYTLAGHPDSTERMDIVIDELMTAIETLETRPYLVLRHHPKNIDSDFVRWGNLFDEVSKGGSPLEIAWISDAVIGMTSILLAEAALMGVPTLSVVPRPAERSWLAGAERGITPSVWTRESLRAVLPRVLHPTRALDAATSVPEPNRIRANDAIVDVLRSRKI